MENHFLYIYNQIPEIPTGISGTPLSSLTEFITIGGAILIIYVGYRIYILIKNAIEREAKIFQGINDNKKNIEFLIKRIDKGEEQYDQDVKDLYSRIDHDKDLLFKKLDENDKENEKRFTSLTGLIIDLFKSSK